MGVHGYLELGLLLVLEAQRMQPATVLLRGLQVAGVGSQYVMIEADAHLVEVVAVCGEGAALNGQRLVTRETPLLLCLRRITH